MFNDISHSTDQTDQIRLSQKKIKVEIFVTSGIIYNIHFLNYISRV